MRGVIHNDPDAYWCGACHKWGYDCTDLVDPLTTRHVPVKSSIFSYAAYDRGRRILELGMHAGGSYQFFGVPLSVALGFVRAEDPAKYDRDHISRQYRFERVRVWETYERIVLKAMLPAIGLQFR